MVRQFDGCHVCPFKLETFKNTCWHRVNELVEAYASYVAQEFVSLGVIYEDHLLPVFYSGLYVPRYKIIFVPEWCLCPVRPVLVVGVYGLTVVHGRALFVVFGFLY